MVRAQLLSVLSSQKIHLSHQPPVSGLTIILQTEEPGKAEFFKFLPQLCSYFVFVQTPQKHGTKLR